MRPRTFLMRQNTEFNYLNLSSVWIYKLIATQTGNKCNDSFLVKKKVKEEKNGGRHERETADN